jgi:transglutaminase-like putative cysteine protease
MSLVLERQRWLGALALAVAAPLPFTGIVSLPFLLPFAVAALAALLSRRPLAPLRPWVENLLAPAIVVAVVAAGGMRYGMLRPVAQLAVLLAAVRLPGAGHPARTLRTAALIALIGVAGIASFTHPVLALYLLLLLAFVVAATGRLEILARAEAAGSDPAGARPPVRLVAATVALALAVAAPLFVLLPRLRSPFAAAPFGSRPVSGFREAVALHQLGTVKLSEELALEVTFPPGTRTDPEWLRLVGATVQHYRAGSWAEGRRSRQLLGGGAAGAVALAVPDPGRPSVRAEIVIRKNAEHLFLPAGAVALELPEDVPVSRDRLGTLSIPRRAETPIRYAVTFQPGLTVQRAPEPEDTALPADAAPVRELAASIAGGQRNRAAAALAVEAHLRTAYSYSTSTFAPVRQDPVLWFLFESRQGHCEFFASSMVMLLRSLGIPARLQAGYAGGEGDGRGGFLVRESQAHAWVVAWLGERWAVFDPTPADGRPQVVGEGGGWSFALGWRQLEAGWDRWVLTFSLADQVDLLREAGPTLRAAAARWRLALGLLATALAAAALLRRVWPVLRRIRLARTSGLSGAIEDLAARARRYRVIADGEATPRRLEREVGEAVPAARPPMRWLVGRHERWRYGGEEAPPRGEVTRASRAVARALDRHRRLAGSGRSASAPPPA